VARILARVYNVRRVDDEVFRSAQPLLAAHLGRLIGHLGLRAVLNLRGAHPGTGWYERESEVCRRAGVSHVSISLSSRKLPQQATLKSILDTLESLPKPVLIKCSGGADRTSLVSGLYLMQQAWGRNAKPSPAAELLALARDQSRFFPYLHLPAKKQRWIRAFFEFYAEDGAGLSPAEWIEQRYTRDRFADYLRGRGMEGVWKEPKGEG
jgi:protein tyrosine phosphatase (PTP) superfamily phosphohydrolase (DUF442 family)